MDANAASVIALAAADESHRTAIGGKAATLAMLRRNGYPVPDGFCLTAAAYTRFVAANGLTGIIEMELERKPLAQMRWEEMWDAALRIRSAFLAADLPEDLRRSVLVAHAALGSHAPLAVRSTAMSEDGAKRSFAGIHESVVGVRGEAELLDAIKRVWASLWSDAAILYAADLELDSSRSAMAVLVQQVVSDTPSGVAFGRDPRSLDSDRCVIEAVPGPCADLVDGRVDPDRWTLRRSSATVLSHHRAVRDGDLGNDDASVGGREDLLSAADLERLCDWLRDVEARIAYPPDIEWTGRADALTLLQARPITTMTENTDGSQDSRAAYLRLRPSPERLAALRDRVVGEIIPGMEAAFDRLAASRLERLDDHELAGALRERAQEVTKWRACYDEDLIPFAHGVRMLGAYYNDAVKADDPFEFVGLLRGQSMIASRRNDALAGFADEVAACPELGTALERLIVRARGSGGGAPPHSDRWPALHAMSAGDAGLAELLRRIESFAHELMNTAYDGERLDERPLELLHTLGQLARRHAGGSRATADSEARAETSSHTKTESGALEARLLDAVGGERHAEARELLACARVAWQLRDDDNILLARIEGELLRALEAAAERLRSTGRIGDEVAGEQDASLLADALERGGTERVELSSRPHWAAEDRATDPKPPGDDLLGNDENARQLIGQPAAPGLATGSVTRVLKASDVGRFHAGDVLVCDAIQPMMTHLVPLATAIVERRGGMLIHGAIIARELNIPCVNGLPRAAEILRDGDVVSVDGYLGIVTIGGTQLD